MKKIVLFVIIVISALTVLGCAKKEENGPAMGALISENAVRMDAAGELKTPAE